MVASPAQQFFKDSLLPLSFFPIINCYLVCLEVWEMNEYIGELYQYVCISRVVEDEEKMYDENQLF